MPVAMLVTVMCVIYKAMTVPFLSPQFGSASPESLCELGLLLFRDSDSLHRQWD